MVDPIQEERIKERMSKNPEYARIMSINKSRLFFEWLMKKIQLRENIILEIKGYTRSGKSTVGITIGKLIAHLTNKQFTQYQVCKNESDHLQKIRAWSKLKKTFNTAWVIDEQREKSLLKLMVLYTHVGVGSYSENSINFYGY